MVIFNSYASLPECIPNIPQHWWLQGLRIITYYQVMHSVGRHHDSRWDDSGHSLTCPVPSPHADTSVWAMIAHHLLKRTTRMQVHVENTTGKDQQCMLAVATPFRLSVFQRSSRGPLFASWPMTDPCMLLYMVTWIPSHQYIPVMLAYIIYTSTMDPSWVMETKTGTQRHRRAGPPFRKGIPSDNLKTCDDQKYGNSPWPSGGTGYTVMRGFWYIKILQKWKDIFSARMFMWYVYQILKPPLLKSIEIKELTAQNLQCPTLKSSSIAFLYIFLYHVFIFKSMCMFIWSLVSVTPPRQSLRIMIDGWVTCFSTSKHTWNHQPLIW